MNENDQLLITCPRCHKTGFYRKGIHAHVCRGVNLLDRHRRLSQTEIALAIFKAEPVLPARREGSFVNGGAS